MDLDLTNELLWLADNVASFAGQISVVLLVSAFGTAITRSRRRGLLLFVLASPFIGLVAASALNDAPVGACPQTAARLRVVTINLLAWNRDGDAVEGFIAESRPDVIATQETTEWWSDRLDALAGEYPFRARSRDGGAQLFSRRPFRGGPGRGIGPSLRRSIVAQIDVGAQAVTVAAVHLLKPVTAADAAIRRRQMVEIAAASGKSSPFVVMGDFNASPTSLDFRSLLAGSALRAPALQFPPVTSWPSRAPMIGLQIDHVLATPGLHFERVASGPRVGSNHLPIIADLALANDAACAP